MAEEETRPLSYEFLEAQRLYQKIDASTLNSNDENLQKDVARAIKGFRTCERQIDQASIFSSNERLDDVQSSHLKYVMTPYYLAMLELKVHDGMQNRSAHLRRAKQCFNEYLHHCEQLEMISSEDRKVFHREGSVNPSAKREEVISRAKRANAASARLQELTRKKDSKMKNKGMGAFEDDDDEDEDERESTIILMQLAILKSLEEMGLTNEELEILEQMERRGPLPTAPNPKAKPPAPKASGPAPPPLGHERNKIVKQVFAKGWRQPTMTVEEAGEIEYEIAKETSERQALAEQKRKEEEGDEDNNYDNDANIRKLREWDEFKDDNPAGSGNRMHQG